MWQAAPQAEAFHFWKTLPVAVLLYNLLMVAWLVGGVSAVSEKTATLATDAERAGAAIGTGLGVTMILIIWVIGAVITGLFALLTRPKSS